MNHPDSVSWMGVLASIHKYQLQIEEKLANTTPRTLPKKAIIVVEGLLLLGDCEGADMVRTEIDKYVVLDTESEEHTQDELCTRKFTRSHLGKISYEKRGVSKKEYRCYWDHYVEPKWIEHGRSRIEDVCPDAIRLDCCGDCDENVQKLLNTGWFSSTNKKTQMQSNPEKQKVMESKHPETSWPRDSDDDEEDEEEDEDDESEEEEVELDNTKQSQGDINGELERSGPSLQAFLMATIAAACASALDPSIRVGVLAVVLLVYWLWRGRKN